jgi:uncharacterized membrane protein
MFSFYIVKADEEEATTTTESENKTEVVESENKAEENVSKQTVTSTEEKKDETNLKEESFKAKVIEAGESYERDNGSGGKETVQDVKVKILEGKNKDEKFSTTYVLTYDLDNKIIGYKLREGNTVFVNFSEENGKVKVSIQDIVRQNYLIGLVIFFFASIILIGRKKGLKSIIGLVITVLAIFFILVATIFKGYNAILVSIGTSFLIIVLTFAIIGGWNKKTFSAALGTLGGVVLAGVIASITGYLAQLSGAGKEEAIMLSVASKDVVFNFRELLFAEIIVSALGACMDVGMSISSSLSELKMKNPSMTGKELFKSGMNIGGDMIGTMTNTLILSFIGSSLVLVLLYMSSSVKFTDVINIEAIATEAVCAIAGSIGIVYTVPITAIIYSFMNRDKEIYKVKSENIVEGKRSLKI